jgi:predicted MFS family arabinose efflux permease
MSGPKRDYSELTTNWRLLLATLVGSAVGFPTLPFFSIGAFTPIFHDAFGWSQSAMLGGLVLASLMILVCGPFVGAFIDRKGPRLVTVASLVGLGLSYMGLAAATGSMKVYYVVWVAMCVTGLGASAISFTRVINSVFVAHRGLALGIALSGSGVFALLVKPFAAWCISAFGWRVALVAIGALPVLFAAPLVWWGFPARWKVAKASPAAAETGLDVRDALRGKTFWLLIVAFVGMGFGIGAPVPNIEAILHDQHLEARAIVNAAALVGVSIILGRLVGGWLLDRMWAPALAMIVLLCAALGCMILSQAHVTVFAASAAIALVGLTAGLEYDMLSYLVARYIGVRHYGAIYSILYGAFAIGAGGGPALLGRAFDLAGSYTTGLWICAGALVVSGACLLLLGPYPTRFSKRSEGNDAQARGEGRADHGLVTWDRSRHR